MKFLRLKLYDKLKLAPYITAIRGKLKQNLPQLNWLIRLKSQIARKNKLCKFFNRSNIDMRGSIMVLCKAIQCERSRQALIKSIKKNMQEPLVRQWQKTLSRLLCNYWRRRRNQKNLHELTGAIRKSAEWKSQITAHSSRHGTEDVKTTVYFKNYFR